MKKTYAINDSKNLWKRVRQINSLEKDIKSKTTAQISARMNRIRKVVRDLSINDCLQDFFINEAFSLIREASRRILGFRHFDVQILCGLVLHYGGISEMKTGEGKTLASTLPSIFNSLFNRTVHIITLNSYLASRDLDWMSKLYKFFGITCSALVSGMSILDKKSAYSSDIVYGDNNEFVFDYLRDNIQSSKSKCITTNYDFAIIDEVDSILIDEAKTPLIVSGINNFSNNNYELLDKISTNLIKNLHFHVNYSENDVFISEKGVKKIEQMLNIENLYTSPYVNIVHNINQSLKAHHLFTKNEHYIIENSQVVLVDENTGRLMRDKKWSNGLHQAVEAKEKVSISFENQTLARISFQDYFNMYDKLSGMTGTAILNKDEFKQVYDLDVVKIPTNKKVIRIDENDKVYTSDTFKNVSIIKDIVETHTKKQPILIGTLSIKDSENLARKLKTLHISCNLLNAKLHRFESEIVAQAGQLSQVTIATSMAGRGTDIILGGNLNFFAINRTISRYENIQTNSKKFSFLHGNIKLINIGIISQANINSKNAILGFIDKYNIKTINLINNKNRIIKNKITSFQKIIFKSNCIFYTKSLIVFNNIIKENFSSFTHNRKKILKIGGLRIIGTEKCENNRIENQLKGRSGRQGDPGSTCYYVSLEDKIIKNFGGIKIKNFISTINTDNSLVISHPWVSKSIERIQHNIETAHFHSRKHLIKYENILNYQRNIVYRMRKKIVLNENLDSVLFWLINDHIKHNVKQGINDVAFSHLKSILDETDNITFSKSFITAYRKYLKKRKSIHNFVNIEKHIFLKIIDRSWKKHLTILEHIKNVIYLKSHTKKDPYEEYRKESYSLFRKMINNGKIDIVKTILNF